VLAIVICLVVLAAGITVAIIGLDWLSHYGNAAR
jgi:hypothetical protein